jgi:hypothetical protein
MLKIKLGGGFNCFQWGLKNRTERETGLPESLRDDPGLGCDTLRFSLSN